MEFYSLKITKRSESYQHVCVVLLCVHVDICGHKNNRMKVCQQSHHVHLRRATSGKLFYSNDFYLNLSKIMYKDDSENDPLTILLSKYNTYFQYSSDGKITFKSHIQSVKDAQIILFSIISSLQRMSK